MEKETATQTVTEWLQKTWMTTTMASRMSMTMTMMVTASQTKTMILTDLPMHGMMVMASWMETKTMAVMVSRMTKILMTMAMAFPMKMTSSNLKTGKFSKQF